ncbi:chromobox protein, partial [Gamsiella multidivaricata]|uniref:chromobox protein n=1 Tax=Gamsiella multidivaricata TaxID=101098 RepID=UPI002220030F
DVYEVEKVVGHKRDRGVLSYHLKWKGYSDADNTWEREKSVFCKDLVAEYWDEWERAGGRRTDIRGSIMKPNIVRRSSVAHKASGSKVEWTSWDEHLECVQTVERSRKKDKMTVHLTWKDGKDTEHPIEDAHQKCPQKLIQFYEKHLKF